MDRKVRYHGAARRSLAAPGADKAVAGAVGLVLMLAVLVTAYANTVRANIPVYGEEAEHLWIEMVASSFVAVSDAVSDGIDAGATTSTAIPKPPPSKTIDLPLLGSAAPHRPSGSVSFEPGCALVSATHTLQSGIVVKDLEAASTGCVEFLSAPVYSLPVGYVYELGGVVREDGDRAVVIVGPPLAISQTSPDELRVTWSMAGLRGDAIGASVDAADVHVDIVPGAAAPEVEQAPNAARFTWTLESAHPAAWKHWYASRFAQAGIPSSQHSVVCDPVDCSTPGGRGAVVVSVEGPRTDVADIKLSITYGLADATLR